MPPVVWVIAGAAMLLLLALSAVTVYGMLRPTMRLRVARWTPSRIALLIGAAALPWLFVWLAPVTIRVSIHGTLQLIGWLCLVLLAFAVLVLLPLVALVSAFIWGKAKRGAS